MPHPGLFGRVLLVGVMVGCRASEPGTPPALGEPLAGLTAEERARFDAGLALFNRVFTSEEGVGPFFNENQCSACHTLPATGGTGEQFVTRASRFIAPAGCDPLAAAGGENVRVHVTPRMLAHGVERQPFPPEATERTRFNVPFIFGLGLIEAIPLDAILANADPEDMDGDGISGRAGSDMAGRLSRFGRKADVSSIREFVQSAAFMEMGLTSARYPQEWSIDGAVYPREVDPAADPELDDSTVDALTDFVRLLAPPPRRMGETEEDRDAIGRGEELFRDVGCTSCHVPSMRTGRDPVSALDNKEVPLYTDLLLHDMGEGLRNVCAPGASPTELRTASLMGLGYRRAFLHDSRAGDLPEAILMHGGEATQVRERYRALTEIQRAYLIRFLQSL